MLPGETIHNSRFQKLPISHSVEQHIHSFVKDAGHTLSMSGSEEIIDFGVEGQPPPSQESNPQHKVAHKRMEATRAQIDEVTGILKKNVDLILQRDEKLSDLDGRADALNDEASEFGKQTGKLRRKYWWQNCKMLAILIGICFVIIVIIIVWAISVEE